MSDEVTATLKCCHTCRMVGKPNQTPPVAPLPTIPAVEPPFTRVLVDMVGALTTTKAGQKYLLAIMDVTIRYLEAMSLRSTHTKVVFRLLPESQSDRGTKFTDKLFAKALTAWGIRHISSACRPQPQEALERHHQTLKTMLRACCIDNDKA